jgi:hypothetical protein
MTENNNSTAPVRAHSAPPQIKVRRAVLADRDALTDFYKRHFPERRRLLDSSVWDWEFARQPGAGDELPFYVLEADGRIEGGIGYWLAQVRVAERTIEAVLPVNYFVAEEFKGLPALRLLRAVLAERDVTLGTNVSADALRLLLKSGFKDIGNQMRSYTYALRITAGLALKARAVAAGRRTAEIGRRLSEKIGQPGIRYRTAGVLDADFLSRIAANDAMPTQWQALVKSPTWLSWRYEPASGIQCEYVYQFRDGLPVALAIIAIDRKKPECERDVVLLDAIFGHSASLPGIVTEVLRLGRDADCSRVVCHALSAPLAAVMRRCLFGSAPSGVGLLVSVRDDSLKRELQDPARWHFMLGDCDAY